MSSGSTVPTTDGARARASEEPAAPRAVAGRLTGGVVLLVVGLLLLAAAVHESLYAAASNVGVVQLTCAPDGSCEPTASFAVPEAWLAVLAIAAATWLIAAAVHELARRSDARVREVSSVVQADEAR